MATKTVLLVTNRRPGDPGGRAEKVATRVRLLSELGWKVVIGHVPEPYVTGFPRRLLSVLRTGRSEGVDAVLSINNPFHLHLQGFLASRLLGLPWVAEFRDPILPRPGLERGSSKWYPAAAVEWLVTHYADRILWFDGIQIPTDYFESTYPDVAPEKFVGLPPMGYEKPKFEAADAVAYDQFTITYAGSFYEGWIEPYDFIEGLGRAVTSSACENPSSEGDDRNGGSDGKQIEDGRRQRSEEDGRNPDDIDGVNIRVQFYGDWRPEYERAATAAGVSDLVDTYEFVPHEEIVPVLKGSDAVLYIGGDDPENRRNIPSKIFDYVGARTPILAVVDPEFRVAEFIRDNRLGIVVPPGNPMAIADAITALTKGTVEYDPEPALFEELTRRQTAQRIAGVLDAVTGNTTSS